MPPSSAPIADLKPREDKATRWFGAYAPIAVPFVAGLAAGVGDSICNYPPYGLHYRKQRGKNIRPWVNPQFYRPRELFRGVFAYSFIIPITCITDGLSDWLGKQGVPGVFSTMLSGFAAGMVVSTPTSNVIIHQQMAAEAAEEAKLAGRTYDLAAAKPRATINRLYADGGWRRFTRGMPTLMIREAAYAMAVFWGKDEVLAACPKLRDYPYFGVGVACLVSGAASTLVSQPMDTMTTWAIKSQRRLSVVEVAKEMYAEKGIRRFYSGTLMRGYAIWAGIVVMSELSDRVKKTLSE